MRAGIGLVGVLLGVGLLMWLYSSFSLDTVKKGKQVEEQVRPIAGYGQDQKPATESFETTGHTRGSKITLEVTSVASGGAMDTYYGLRVGDEITAVGDMELAAMSGGDEGLAKSLVVSEGYQKQKPIKVKRGGQIMTLPAPPGAPSAAAVPTPASAPAQPAPQPQKSQGISGQLDAIRNAGGAVGQDQ